MELAIPACAVSEGSRRPAAHSRMLRPRIVMEGGKALKGGAHAAAARTSSGQLGPTWAVIVSCVGTLWREPLAQPDQLSPPSNSVKICQAARATTGARADQADYVAGWRASFMGTTRAH